MDNHGNSIPLPNMNKALAGWQIPNSFDLNAPLQLDLTGQPLRYGFRVGDYGLMIDANTTSEVMQPLAIFRMPNTIAELLGLVNLRGNLVPIYDLHRILGIAHTSQNRMMLVIGEGNRAVGMMIDGLPQAATLNQPLRNLPTLPGALEAYIGQAYVDAGVTWLEFQHQDFFKELAARAG